MAAPPDTIHRCAVLVVDDDPDMREVLAVALRSQGYDVATVGNARDALTHLRSTPETCMIVLDLMLPGMAAARFAEVLRRDRSLAWIPVVVLSGAEDGANDARALGARVFLRKPVDVEALRRALHRIGCSRARPRSQEAER